MAAGDCVDGHAFDTHRVRCTTGVDSTGVVDTVARSVVATVMSGTQSSVTCPECETAFDPTAEGGWCTECGKYQASDAGAAGEAAGAADAGGADDASGAPDDAGKLTVSPAEPAEPAEGATAEDEAAPETDDTGCPSCGEAIEPDWNACPFCAAELSPPAAAAEAESAAPVVLEIGEQELTAPLGESVGREVRTAHVETGGSEHEAQYVHREHVRFERDGEAIVVVNEGRNGATLNDTSLAVDERAVVTDGDRLVFSGRVAATVRLDAEHGSA